MSIICSNCGCKFESLPYPANIHPDDPNPLCNDCIEKELDSVEAEPLLEEVTRILNKVTKLHNRTQRALELFKKRYNVTIGVYELRADYIFVEYSGLKKGETWRRAYISYEGKIIERFGG